MTDETPDNKQVTPGLSFGTLVGAPAVQRLPETTFRIAILGDFSGRANHGERSTADDIANLPARVVEFDTLDETIAAFNPRLRIPIAGGKSHLDFSFKSLDDFHADSLFESVELIDGVQGIGRRIDRSVEKALNLFAKWADAPLTKPHSTVARGITIPDVDSIADFASVSAMPTVSPETVALDSGALLEAMCAPHIRPVVNSGAANKAKLAKAATEATNATVREFVQHPDFQTVEGAWREADWLLRRTQKNPNIEIVLFDISAEEFAADLSTDGDLAEAGLFRLLVDKTAEGIDAEPWAAVVGRYQFDFNTVHSQLLGRMGKIGQRLNAPFLTGFTNKLLDADLKIKDKDLVKAWMQLRSLPESSWIGIGLPGFLLRMPYGKKGMTLDSFPFEEFSPRAGSRGFLWGNPGTFCAALLARTFTETQKMQFDPNANRVLDNIPLFALHLPNGESVTFCSEKRFAASTAAQTAGLGLIPLQAMKGRDSIVATEVRALNHQAPALRGPWSGVPEATPAASAAASLATAVPETAAATTATPAVTPAPTTDQVVTPAPAAAPATPPADSGGLDPELAALLGETPPAAAPATPPAADTGGLDPELAALLGESPTSPAAPTPAPEETDGLDPELAALLGDTTAPATPAAQTADVGGLDPELAALLGESPTPDTPPAAPADTGGLDPELAALLGDTSGDSTPDPNATPDNDDDDGLDPELAALLNG